MLSSGDTCNLHSASYTIYFAVMRFLLLYSPSYSSNRRRVRIHPSDGSPNRKYLAGNSYLLIDRVVTGLSLKFSTLSRPALSLNPKDSCGFVIGRIPCKRKFLFGVTMNSSTLTECFSTTSMHPSISSVTFVHEMSTLLTLN